MTLSNSPFITPLPRRENSAEAVSPEQDRVSELRGELEGLTRTISDLTALSAARIERLSATSVAGLRGTIESQPWMSLGTAAALGAVLAIAIVPKRAQGFRGGSFSSYDPYAIAASMRKAVARGIDTQPLTSRFERLVDSISSIDPSAVTSSPAYDTAKTWLQAFVSGARKA